MSEDAKRRAEEAEKRAEAAEQRARQAELTRKTEHSVRHIMRSHGVRPDAEDDAVVNFMALAEIEYDDDPAYAKQLRDQGRWPPL